MQRNFFSALARYRRAPQFSSVRTASTKPKYKGTIFPPGYSNRTVRVDNLPQEYDLNSILNAIQANPVERIITRHDHVLVQFFSEEMAQRCVRDYEGLLSLAIHPHPSPPLSCFTVAAIGYLSLSRAMEISDIPPDITEDIFQDEVHCSSVRVDRSESKARARLEFLDVHDAIKAKTTLVRLESFQNAKISYVERPGRYMYPSWFTPSSSLRTYPMVPAVVECRRWTNAADSVMPTVLSSARFSKTQVRKSFRSPYTHPICCTQVFVVSFGTAESARNFIETYQPRAKIRGMKMSLAQDKSQYVDRNILSARDLGANRKLHIHIGREHRRSDEDYVKMFSRYGGIASIADRFQDGASHGTLWIEYQSVQGAMRAAIALCHGANLSKALQGADFGFYSTQHLKRMEVPQAMKVDS
ncbi:hypothetical protein EDD18DRAFT_1152527 [Armillaria luteobubalina]|uniref:RRM domain-containing protein n=1 Tax=Armillaria luteobubalina TaxID=153913 RepID=A0AA39QDZ0_9AGAR|nr:hypothetical protein EDD18DRAFT_1152527 [Armillaria luteobubalina]